MREQLGDHEGAIAILEQRGGQSRSQTGIDDRHTIFWMGNRLRLAQLLHEVDPARAAGIESELRDMLVYADPDHFVLKELQKRPSDSEE